MNGIDTSQLDSYTQELIGLAKRDLPKQARAFVLREGSKLQRRTAGLARQRVRVGGRHQGAEASRYHRNIKRGRVYIYRGNGGVSVRVHSGKAPHAHLIEYGHRIVGRGGRELGFVPGKHVFEDAAKAFAEEFNRDVEDFLEEVFP